MSGSGAGDDDYEVGRGKTPRATRFKKGISGNPKGRPRKTLPEPSWEALGASDLFLSFLDREFAGTENGQPVTLRGADALMKAMMAKGLKGGDAIQRTLFKHMLDFEKRAREQRSAVLLSALEAQIRLDHKLAVWLAAGRSEADINVHPRDIEIDWRTGDVRMFVALTQEQLEARAEAINLRDECEAAILVGLAAAAEDGDDGILKLVREVARGLIEQINLLLPSRFRRAAPGEDASDLARAALEPLSEATREASCRWSLRMAPYFKSVLGY